MPMPLRRNAAARLCARRFDSSSSSRRANLAITVTAMSLAFAGCGGGGGDSPSFGGSTSSSDPIDKYMGTIVTSCQTSTVYVAGTHAALKERSTLTAKTKVSTTKASYQLRTDFYGTSNCSGTKAGSATVSSDSFIQIDGTTTIKGQVVDKITADDGVYFPGISAGTITINGLVYTLLPYTSQARRTYKDLLQLKGTDLYAGDSSVPVDSGGYPTAMDAVPFAVVN